MSNDKRKIAFLGTLQVALEMFEAVGSPRSLSMYLLAKNYLLDTYEPLIFARESKGLGFDINWYDQKSINSFRDDFMVTNLLSKLPPLDDDPSLREAALLGLRESEARNRITSSVWCNESKVDAMLFQHGSSLDDLRGHVRRLLGRAPSLEQIVKRSYFTEGASVTFSRNKSCAARKCEDGVTVTPALARALWPIAGVNPLISRRQSWLLVPGNLVDTVPKNIETDRTIGMEPELNALVQRGIGDDIRHRIKRWGIDLSNQGINQSSCRLALLWDRATLDMRNASNSVVARVVESTFSDEWWALLDCARSPHGTTDGRESVSDRTADWTEYSMLSSMGNGFTFEVESVLFFAIAASCGVPYEDIQIYGDDLIIPQSYVSSVVAVLGICGFEVNKEKSFTSGTFFESCGVYCFHNVDVTPFKIKELLYGNQECIVLANKVRLFAHAAMDTDGCDRRFLAVYRAICNRLSDKVFKRCRGPVGSGITLFVNRSEALMQYSRKRGHLRLGQLVPRSGQPIEADGPGLLRYRLYEQVCRSSSVHPHITWLRGTLSQSERKLNVIKNYVPNVSFHLIDLFVEGDSWYDLGPWVTRGCG